MVSGHALRRVSVESPTFRGESNGSMIMDPCKSLDAFNVTEVTEV